MTDALTRDDPLARLCQAERDGGRMTTYELTWYDPVVHVQARYTTREVQMYRRVNPEHAFVIWLLGAGSRHERVFTDPGSFDIFRDDLHMGRENQSAHYRSQKLGRLGRGVSQRHHQHRGCPHLDTKPSRREPSGQGRAIEDLLAEQVAGTSTCEPGLIGGLSDRGALYRQRDHSSRPRRAPGRLVEGQISTNWKRSLEQLALVYQERLDNVLDMPGNSSQWYGSSRRCRR